MRHLSWAHTLSGPSHDIRWLAIAYFSGIEYGRGVARTRATAMEIAAETVYHALTSYLTFRP
ncbi:hypothetical protein EV363DRAFT_1400126 [Boletus edulis]|uniref:DRBM domain-containing protein n=1 Tax=Boletus edulis BED1 TaxID=1328754 RepID=A0AAD4BD11_BOLED|nr:hypothetical protein EV363DRAFT_1400126 [Boletus edulis]KAF8418785.1 hypothetical protein L210DRAFT_151728 [Boletus edulis BED1]